MGGNLTMYVAGTDERVKAVVPAVGGSGWRWQPHEMLGGVAQPGPERLCADLANARLVETMSNLAVTASFGVVGCCGDDDADSVMSRVDAALYEAKAAGRNRVSGLACF